MQHLSAVPYFMFCKRFENSLKKKKDSQLEFRPAAEIFTFAEWLTNNSRECPHWNQSIDFPKQTFPKKHRLVIILIGTNIETSTHFFI